MTSPRTPRPAAQAVPVPRQSALSRAIARRIGQPWLSLLIDYYSRMVVGFCLGFEPPSCAVLMEALRHAILR